MKENLKEKMKKVGAVLLASTMLVGMIPVGAVQTSAATAKKAYNVVVKPKLSYDMVDGMYGNSIIVGKSKNDMDLWGLVDKNGKVIIPCSYVSAQVFNGKVVLLCDRNSQWSIRNLSGKLIKKLSKEYDYSEEQNGQIILGFYDGTYDLIDYNGKITKENQTINEDSLGYKGKEKFDNLCLLQDKKHYLGCKYLDGSEEDGYTRFYYKMVEADGTVVADMGTGSYWEQINKDIIQVDTISENDDNISQYKTLWVNMDGKIVSDVNNKEYYNNEVNSSSLELYNNNEYVRYSFPSLSVEKKITLANGSETISKVSLINEKIYYKANNQWYFVDKNTGKRQKSSISDSVEEIHKVNASTIITYQQGRLTGNVTIMDSGEKIKKQFDYNSDYVYCTEDGNNVIVKYNKENGNEAADIINTYSLTKILTGYEDVDVSDADYYSAYKNGKLYLVSKDGKNTSEIGEGAYCYIYSYDEYKELNLLKIDVFSNRGVWKNTYLFDYNGKKVTSLPYNSSIVPVAFEKDAFLVKVYNNDYRITSSYVITKNGKKTISGTMCSYESDSLGKIKKLAIRDKNKNWKLYCGEGKKAYSFGKHGYLEFDGNIAYGYEIRNGKDCNYEVVSATDGTVIFKKGQIQSISESTNNLNPVKIDGKWGIYKFNKWTSADQKRMKNVPPAKTTLQKVKAGKKKATVSFKKVSDADGYLIQYSLKKNFKGAKSKYVTKTKATLSRLKADKKYFFRVKSYKKNGSKKVTAKKWSNVKSAKIK